MTAAVSASAMSLVAVMRQEMVTMRARPGSSETRPWAIIRIASGQQRVLGRVDRGLERVAVAVGRDRHRALEDDRPRVDARVDEVDRHAGDPHAVRPAPARSRRGRETRAAAPGGR